jgi:hypothetical protein
VASDSDDTRPAPGQRRHRWWLLAAGLAVVLCVQLLFVVSYVGALHAPKPHELAFGITGPSRLAAAVGERVSLKTTVYPSEAAVRHAIDERDVDAGLVDGPKGATLIVAPAAGNLTVSTLSAAFGAAAAALRQKLVVVQVHTLPSSDPSGALPFMLVMALVVGGYLAATIAMVLGGPATQRRRLPILAGVAVLGALLTYTIAGPAFDALVGGHFSELFGIFVLVMLAVAYATAALQTLLGAGGTLIVVVAFVIFGAPSAGGSVPRPFLPGFWATIGPYLPPGAGTTAVRNVLYFDGNAITHSVLVLVAYLIVGAAVLIVVRRRRPADDTVEAEAEAAAAVAGTVIV